jgi:SAM-dependent methyltransferase
MDDVRTESFGEIRRREPAGAAPAPLFDRIRWRDPVSGSPLEPLVSARTPAGVPICGALRVAGTRLGYPIVDCVARLTPALAEQYREWLAPFGLEPVPPPRSGGGFQPESTVESFGFQWNWHSEMRTEADLAWRVAGRFQVDPELFRGKLTLDAGAGAGDQSRWILARGAEVVSVDLSNAINVVARKLRMNPGWVGVQGDVTALPLQDGQFELVYCEGVIQHTRDSAMAVRELARVLAPGGLLLATHYDRSKRLLGRIKLRYVEALRARWSRKDRDALLLTTGRMAALAQLPLLGPLLRLSGTVMVDRRMPDFKTTWVNTYDAYGPHAFQRYVATEAFWGYIDQADALETQFRDGAAVVARKEPRRAALRSASVPAEAAVGA